MVNQVILKEDWIQGHIIVPSDSKLKVVAIFADENCDEDLISQQLGDMHATIVYVKLIQYVCYPYFNSADDQLEEIISSVAIMELTTKNKKGVHKFVS